MLNNIRTALESIDRLPHSTSAFEALASLLKRCCQSKSLPHARILHAYVTQYRYDRTTFLGNWLVQMYGDCGSMGEARAVFDALRNANLHSWTILMKGYVKNGCGREALECFQQMQLKGIKLDHVAFISALQACGIAKDLEKGRQIHEEIANRKLVATAMVGTALVDMYGKCGNLEEARNVFRKMLERNVISWTAMMAACSHNRHSKEALALFQEMQADGIKPNKITFLCAIDACARLANLETGRAIHTAAAHNGDEDHMEIGNALVHMYGKCGSVEDAKSVFDRMAARNIVSWSSIIAAYSQNGYANAALDLFHQMLHEGLKPNHFTFLSILMACRQLGQVDAGWRYFDCITQTSSGVQSVEHYVCLIDLLGRVGRLDDAEKLVNSMPFSDNPRGWLCLLAACKLHGDVERAVRAANKAFELDPTNSAPYVLLSDIYAAADK